MLTKLTEFRTSTYLYISLSKTCDLCGGAIFGPQRHSLNKLGSGSLDDATNIIYQGFRSSGFGQEDSFFF